MSDELRGILRALEPREGVARVFSDVRDKAAAEGRPEWAALWAFLAAEVADVNAERRHEWNGFVEEHSLGHIPFTLDGENHA